MPTSQKNLKRPERHRAFTLLELLVVLAIMAAISAVVAVRLAEPYRTACGAHQTAELGHWLNRVREHSYRHGCSAVVTIDIDHGLLAHQPSTTIDGCRELRLDSVLRIVEIRLGGRQIDQGTVDMHLAPSGTSESFALQLVPSGGQPRWLFIAGGSGQPLELATEEEVDHAFGMFEASAHAR